MNIIWAIAIANIKSLFRNFKSAGIMFILPVVFMAIFGLAFGQDFSTRTHHIGFVMTENESYDVYKGVLEEIKKSEDSDELLFDIQEYETAEEAEEAIINDEIDL